MDKHVMISYDPVSSGDLALLLNTNLKRHNYKTWIDYEKLKSDDIWNEIAKAINASFLVLVLVTNDYCKVKSCNQQCDYALLQGKCVIPIKVNSNYTPSELPGVMDLPYVDFSQENFDICFSRLLLEVNKMRNKQIEFIKFEKSKNTQNENERSKNFCMKNIKSLLTIAIMVIIAVTLVISIIVLSMRMEYIKKLFKNNQNIEMDYRYSLKISQNESIYYNGQSIWNYVIDSKRNTGYVEKGRDEEGVIVSSGNEKIRLSTLNYTNMPPQPKWSKCKWNNVWKVINENIYFFPAYHDTWIELHNNTPFAEHVLKKIEEDVYYFNSIDSNFYFKIRYNSLYLGKSFDNITMLVKRGQWINYN